MWLQLHVFRWQLRFCGSDVRSVLMMMMMMMWSSERRFDGSGSGPPVWLRGPAVMDPLPQFSSYF